MCIDQNDWSRSAERKKSNYFQIYRRYRILLLTDCRSLPSAFSHKSSSISVPNLALVAPIHYPANASRHPAAIASDLWRAHLCWDHDWQFPRIVYVQLWLSPVFSEADYCRTPEPFPMAILLRHSVHCSSALYAPSFLCERKMTLRKKIARKYVPLIDVNLNQLTQFQLSPNWIHCIYWLLLPNA